MKVFSDATAAGSDTFRENLFIVPFQLIVHSITPFIVL